MNAKGKKRVAAAVALVMLFSAVVLGIWMLSIRDRAVNLDSFPVDRDFTAIGSGCEFPVVDWQYWLSVNPSIVAWVTVPDTNIDYPVVQASVSDPTFYLNHDVYQEWNPYGCPYLDAGCAEQGLDSLLAIMFAHHMSDDSMFSVFANYSDAAFAESHCRILLQTPKEKVCLSVIAVDVINSDVEYKQLGFISGEQLDVWLQDLLASADVVLDSNIEANSIKAFCTCSYGRWSGHERTIVYAVPQYG